jgi:hypothetical protein
MHALSDVGVHTARLIMPSVTDIRAPAPLTPPGVRMLKRQGRRSRHDVQFVTLERAQVSVGASHCKKHMRQTSGVHV